MTHPNTPEPSLPVAEAAYLPFDAPLWQQHEHCIRRLMAQTPMPNSLSIAEAMKQLIRDVRYIDSQRATPIPDTSAGEREMVQPSIATKQSTDATGDSASETAFGVAMDALEQNCWDLRCVDIPTGAGDADIGWQIVEHHMAPPKERIIGYGNSPLEALNDAIAGDLSEAQIGTMP